jgi:hypothetical protein
VQRTSLEEEFKGVMRPVSIEEMNSGFLPSRMCSLLIKVINPEQSKLIIDVTG